MSAPVAHGGHLPARSIGCACSQRPEGTKARRELTVARKRALPSIQRSSVPLLKAIPDDAAEGPVDARESEPANGAPPAPAPAALPAGTVSLGTSIATLLAKTENAAEASLLLTACGLGVATGGGIVLFNVGIHSLQHFMWSEGPMELQIYLKNHLSLVEHVLWTEPPREYQLTLRQFQKLDLPLELASWPWLAVVPALGGAAVGALRQWAGGFDDPFDKARERAAAARAAAAGNAAEPWVPPPSPPPAWVPSLRPVLKTLGAVITLGTGAALGPEGPSVEIGTNVGRLVGKVLGAGPERRLTLQAAGAAAGIAAGFNVAIAGVFFAVETVFRQDGIGSAGKEEKQAIVMVLLAAVLAGVVSQAGLGNEPAFSLPRSIHEFGARSWLDLPLCLGLGGATGAMALLFNSLSACGADFYARADAAGLPPAAMPVVGGLATGLLALFFPEILYQGFENLSAILERPELYPPSLLLQIVGAKLLATAVFCRASGLVGGVYAPSLFLGAALGAAWGQGAEALVDALEGGAAGLALTSLSPAEVAAVMADAAMAVSAGGEAATGAADAAERLFTIAPPSIYAFIGMGSALAGVCRVPLTAVLLLFELTRDFNVILPVMAAVSMASWVASAADRPAAAAAAESAGAPLSPGSSLLSGTPSGTGGRVQSAALLALLSADGAGPAEPAARAAEEAAAERLLAELTVGSVMVANCVRLAPGVPLGAAVSALRAARRSAGLVVDAAGDFLGLVTMADLRQAALRQLLAAERSASEGAPASTRPLCVCDVLSSGSQAAVQQETSLESALGQLTIRGLQQLAVVSTVVLPDLPSSSGGGQSRTQTQSKFRALGMIELDDIRTALDADLARTALCGAGLGDVCLLDWATAGDASDKGVGEEALAPAVALLPALRGAGRPASG